MSALKEKIIQEIDSIQDEDVLNKIQFVLENINSKNPIMILSNEQKVKIALGEKDFKEGRFYTTEELFDDLLNG